jgi:hypothetical protein
VTAFPPRAVKPPRVPSVMRQGDDAMDPVLAELISEGVKIIGPALIAAGAAYFAASLQFKATLGQIREANEFAARQHLFDYYKDKQRQLSESYNELSNTLGQVLGVNAAPRKGKDDESIENMVSGFDSIAQLHIDAAPFEIGLTLRDMRSKKLDSLQEFKQLTRRKQALDELNLGGDFQSKKNTVLSLLELYAWLKRCNQLLLEKEMDLLFSKYDVVRA